MRQKRRKRCLVVAASNIRYIVSFAIYETFINIFALYIFFHIMFLLWKAPYLQLHFGGKESHRRHRRSTNMQCTEELDSEVTQCCIWPLTIDFDEFGWDWVLFPRTYEANFCSGDCSLGRSPSATHPAKLNNGRFYFVNISQNMNVAKYFNRVNRNLSNFIEI